MYIAIPAASKQRLNSNQDQGIAKLTFQASSEPAEKVVRTALATPPIVHSLPRKIIFTRPQAQSEVKFEFLGIYARCPYIILDRSFI